MSGWAVIFSKEAGDVIDELPDAGWQELQAVVAHIEADPYQPEPIAPGSPERIAYQGLTWLKYLIDRDRLLVLGLDVGSGH